MMRLTPLLFVTAACGSVVANDDGGGNGGNHAPTAISLSAASVDEQAPPATAIGTLSAEDSDASDTITFALTNDAGGLFSLSGAEVRVATGAVLNYEAAATQSITVRATDAAGASIEQTFEIKVRDIREVINLDDTGAGSLRQTLADAAPGEIVLFESGLTGRISVLTPLVLTKAVTLRGPADRSITLDALHMGFVIKVSVGATVTLADLEIIQGVGAITNDGTLTVLRSLIRDSSTSGRGGAIANNSTLTVIDSEFRNNSAFNGGAIAADGPETTVIGSTFDSNATNGNSGGAIVGGPMQVINSTFSGNAATGSNRVGGAIGVFAGANVIAFSTFAQNTATGNGGGLYVSASANATVRASIFAANTAPTGPDADATTATGSDNILSNGAGTTFTNGSNNNLVGVLITLGSLSDNSGPTKTRLPAATSAAIDHVPSAACLNLMGQALVADQRGSVRPMGAGCDAGAVEVK